MGEHEAIEENEPTTKSFTLSNRGYNVLKFIAQIFLPALGTLYFALAELWNLPKAQEVVGTIMAVDVFLGVLLGLSTRSYNNSDAKYDGNIVVERQPDDSKMYSLVLNSDPTKIDAKKEVVFKVHPEDNANAEGV